MLISKSDQRMEVRQHPHDGAGQVVLYHLAEPAHTFDKCRLIARTVIEPGCSMGYHVHQDEMEFFYVLKGTLMIDDNGTETLVHEGDSFITGEGEGHSVTAYGGEPAEYIAIVVLK